ncbi:MAG: 3-phosphoglycerate dehydrogenase [Prevotellaceae bacterium]|jgi:D-3-phosphoglycerate dehydrogenase|nr:3-phosphoglycerate dehydrogenase [Prevotellaceae bacterium]
MRKILLATEKPFSAAAVAEIRQIVEQAGDVLETLEKYADPAQLAAAAATADALIVRSDKVTREIIAAAPKLKIIVRAGAGYDNLDLEACTAAGITAMNTPGQNSNAVAELVIGLMTYMARNQFAPGTGSELRGKKLGIHAYGNVGRLVAAIGKGAGMTVEAYDPFVGNDTMKQEGVTPLKTVEELYSTADYISIHIPATAETKHSINHPLLARLPKNATIINTARKEVIDEQGLIQLMNERPDIKYAADVAPDADEEFKTFGTRYYATKKKIGAETSEANINAGLAAARQIVEYFTTGNQRYKVN